MRNPERVRTARLGVRASHHAAVPPLPIQRIAIESVRIERRARISRSREMAMERPTIAIHPAEQKVVRMHARGFRDALEVKAVYIRESFADRVHVAHPAAILLRQALQLGNQD